MSDLECFGGPLDGERYADCPVGAYERCVVTNVGEVWFWWPYRCGCGQAIAKHRTICTECAEASPQ